MTITRDDIEAKANQLVAAVGETGQSAKSKGIAGVVAIGLVVAVVFLVGRRRGSKSRTYVEVYKV